MAERNPLISPTEFENIEEWRSYVRRNVPAEDVDYTLACGRTALYVRFYEMRGQPFPEEFRIALNRVELSPQTERSSALETLNGQIFADMTNFLFAAAPKQTKASESVVPNTPREIAEELLQHMARRNPYFAIWVHYQKREMHDEDAISWVEFVACEVGSGSGDEFDFTLLMAELGMLLRHYRDHDLQFPPRTRYAMWFLHHVRGPQRNLQTRVLVQQLIEAISSCGSA
jgi:hypothetical protein